MTNRYWATGIVVSVLISLASVLGGAHPGNAATTTEVNVRDFGAKGDGVTDDTAAIQKANDAVAKQGGGRVYFPAATYIAAGVIQDSGVEFYGTHDAILKHPNGSDPTSMVTNRLYKTTGSIVSGSNMVRLASSANVAPGSLIAIRGAGARTVGQSTGNPILYAGVSSLYRNDAFLTTRALLTVSGATVTTGSSDMSIRGLTFDGNKPVDPPSGSFMAAISYNLARNATVSDCVIKNSLNNGVRFDLGTQSSTASGNHLTGNGWRSARLGFAIFVFRGSANNTVSNNIIDGDTYIGIDIDDRTQTASDWDGSPTNNVVEGNTIDYTPIDRNAAIYLSGAKNNVVRNNTLSNVQAGIEVDKSVQGSANFRDSTGNTVTGNSLASHVWGLRVSGSNNTFTSNTIAATTTPVEDTGSQNSYA